MKQPSRLVVASALLGLAAISCKRTEAKQEDARSEAQRTFAMVCARCHGQDGSGQSLTPTVTPARNFRDPVFQKERSDADLARAIREGKGAMPPFQNVYTPEQVNELVQLIRGFDK
jgi:mono/diheme cytochrome c family protein